MWDTERLHTAIKPITWSLLFVLLDKLCADSPTDQISHIIIQSIVG